MGEVQDRESEKAVPQPSFWVDQVMMYIYIVEHEKGATAVDDEENRQNESVKRRKYRPTGHSHPSPCPCTLTIGSWLPQDSVSH
jgi:hypothetical protein